MRFGKISVGILAALALTACSHSDSSNNPEFSLSLDTNQVYLGFNGPSNQLTVNVDQAQLASSMLGTSSGSVTNLSITSGLPAGVTASYNDGTTTSPTACENVPVGGSCTITLTSNNPSASGTETTTLTLAATNSSNTITVPLTLEWPTVSFSSSTITGPGANNISIINSGHVPVQITTVSSNSSDWTVSPGTCSNTTLTNNGDSCIFTASSSSYTTTPASITVTGSNLDANAPITTNISTSTTPPTISAEVDSSGSSNITFPNTSQQTKTVTVDNSASSFSMPITISDVSSHYNVSVNSSSVNCSGSGTSYTAAAGGSCIFDFQDQDYTTPIIDTLQVNAGEGLAIETYNLIVAGTVTLSSGHADEAYPAYEYVQVNNNTAVSINTISISGTNLPSSITRLTNSQTAPNGTSGDTCTGQTITAGNSCKVWFYNNGTAPSTSTSGTIGGSYVQSGNTENFTALSVTANTYLYAGGTITSVSGTSVNNIAAFNGSNWSALGTGTNNQVNALATDSLGDLYVGGTFTSAGGNTITGLAKWDGASWSAIGLNSNPIAPNDVNSLAVDSSNNLYAGLEATGTNFLLKWTPPINNDSTQGSIGFTDFFANTINALTLNGTTLYAGGSFSYNGSPVVSINTTTSAITALPNADWGMTPTVYALLYANNQLYVGGNFTMLIGSANANSLVSYSSGSWQQLGTADANNGVNGVVKSLAYSANNNTGLLVGGSFLNNGASTLLNNVGYSWNNTIPQPLVFSGFPGAGNPGESVNALLYISTQNLVFIGGNFNATPIMFGANINNSPSSWFLSSLGGTSGNTVNALAIGSTLCVGSGC